MKKIRFLIVSGPTQEPLDPVRFISNRSTGVMGRRLARAARGRGHRVTWVECPSRARTALDLERLLKKILPRHDVLVMAAAVCDVRPQVVSASKIKKKNLRTLRLVRNPDILARLARRKRKNQVFIGFGLESADLLRNGFKKLREKGLELIVLQKMTKSQTPFGDRPIDAVVLDGEKNLRRFHSVSKSRLADFLIREAERFLARWPRSGSTRPLDKLGALLTTR